MNKKDYMRYMKQGLGRCILTLKGSDDIAKYQEIVLWGCLHNLSFDPQCEGTRAAYVYELASCYEDTEYFVLPLIKAFHAVPLKFGWLFNHYCELLRLFAKSGNSDSQAALQKKYDELLPILINKRRFSSNDFERDNFASLCISLISMGNEAALWIIVNDIGTLFKQNEHYDGFDFETFFAACEDTYGKKAFDSILKHRSKESDNIRCFYEKYSAFGNILQRAEEKQNGVPSIESIKGELDTAGRLSHATKYRFIKRAGDTEKKKLAEAVLEEQDPIKKAELLSVFISRDTDFPLSHESIIAYSESGCERLSDVALQVLTNCKSNIARAYAYELLAHKCHISNAIRILLNNYVPKDKEILLSEIYKLRVDYQDESEWHTIGLKILDVYDRKGKLPEEFLLYIYNTTLCSCCREHAIKTLAKHKWLTADLIEECRYDSNADISEYINRYYPQK